VVVHPRQSRPSPNSTGGVQGTGQDPLAHPVREQAFHEVSAWFGQRLLFLLSGFIRAFGWGVGAEA
jgi:hypothetical protein